MNVPPIRLDPGTWGLLATTADTRGIKIADVVTEAILTVINRPATSWCRSGHDLWNPANQKHRGDGKKLECAECSRTRDRARNRQRAAARVPVTRETCSRGHDWAANVTGVKTLVCGECKRQDQRARRERLKTEGGQMSGKNPDNQT